MDGIVILIFGIILTYLKIQNKETKADIVIENDAQLNKVPRVAKLNEVFYRDETAFTKLSTILLGK